MTWFYISTLIILTIFFKFNRTLCVRNFDLLLLLCLSPGLILLAMDDSQLGYIWIFVVNGFCLIRMCFDTVMVRRPMLEPNLAPGALSFSCLFLFLFVLLALTVNRGNKIDTIRTVRLEHILTTRHLAKKIGMNPATLEIPYKELPNIQPGFLPFISFSEHSNLVFTPPPKVRVELLNSTIDFNSWGAMFIAINKSISNYPSDVNSPQVDISGEQSNQIKLDSSSSSDTVLSSSTSLLPSTLPQPPPVLVDNSGGVLPPPITSPSEVPTIVMLGDDNIPSEVISPAEETIMPPTLGMMFLFIMIPIVAQFMIVFGFLYIGHCHFGNIRTGAACATLYMLLPYTNQMVGRLDHIVPAALIIWGVCMYRRPICSGLCIGSAAALVFYPICLVPLWSSFYWRKGWVRFLIGTSVSIVVFMFLLRFSPSSLGSYGEQLVHMFGKSSLRVFSAADGFWSYHEVIYRVPLLACYFAVCFGMIMWPRHKHLAILLSCSTIIMLGTQFWQLHQGGLFMAWYVPLLILTIFRPNLEDKVAHSVVV
ncbi:MAG: DUF2029 domain-containing protein [Planctomycetaceae bacterium]|nr:DUF2029 domain-containing protein [Planctomycetaceae bacterium]